MLFGGLFLVGDATFGRARFALQIARTRAQSQWIVRQAYSHTYNTQFYIKVVYRGFNAQHARKAQT